MTNIHAQALGKLGGKKSVISRFNGKTKTEISEAMRRLRYSKQEVVELDTMSKELVTGLKKGTKRPTH